VVHRDLKPGNLFVVQRADGKPWLKVLDFGISKVVAGGGPVTSSLTVAQAIVGSPLYMSPEQIRASDALDARSDIWSMGVILYELLTGRRPFVGTTLSALVVSIATEQPPAPSTLVPNLPEGIESVVLRCLQKDSTARFASVGELVEALTQVKEQGLTAPSRPRASVHVPSARWQLVSFAGVGLLSLGGSSWWWLRGDSSGSFVSKPEVSVGSLGVDLPARAPLLPVVHCERPLPSGQLQLSAAGAGAQPGDWQRTFALDWLCEAEASAERSRELLGLLQGAPTPPRVVLETGHPFAVLDWEPGPEQLSIQLRYARLARVVVALTGPLCDKVQSVQLQTADEASLSAAVATAAGNSREERCLLPVELPLEAFGRRLRFRFQPAELGAKEAVFTSSPIQLEVRHVRGKAAARCVPPQYCRD
ncbi:MAG: hypothetical protein RL033_3548, partial [Pseudomonadota bacterium]